MPKEVEVTFINSVAVSGFANGVCNFALSTARYVPGKDADGKAIVVIDEFVSANLRMDLFCAQQLHDSLATIIKQNTVQPTKAEVN